jgi:hypothetical protein
MNDNGSGRELLRPGVDLQNGPIDLIHDATRRRDDRTDTIGRSHIVSSTI